MTETEWSIRNLELAGMFDKDSDYGGMLGTAVKDLLLLHQKEHHSGMSHAITVKLFHDVALGKALTLEFWQEKFKAYNEFAKEEGHDEWTEEKFSEIVMEKPKHEIKKPEKIITS